MSFTNAPVTRSVIYGIIGFSIAASLFDVKHYFYILVDLHLWRFHQTWRLLLWELCYSNSSEVLFAAMALYNMRMVERFWGPRKFASFVFATYLLTSIATPLLLALLMRPLTFGLLNYLPAGPTPIVFAVMAQYHAMIPHTYQYKIATSISAENDNQGITLSDKSYRYLLAAQLALSQWPGSVLAALMGWLVGYSWRMEILPRRLTRWRLPGWVLGVRAPRRNEEFEGLRRRMEGDAASATTTGAQAGGDAADGGRRRTMGQQFMDQFRGGV
ncbi:ubiquitin-associated domain-containing protein 2 [Microdochium nivale]|nr:ubiquitin-associated domain-containing protein 2 [Microdochium nivale]